MRLPGTGVRKDSRSLLKTRRRSRRPRNVNRPRYEVLEERALMTVYNIGPGQSYTTLGSFPWSGLQPGDTVDIHWQAGGYHEKLLLSESGTTSQPINIVGVPGPEGQEPVIDGENATTSSQFDYFYSGIEEDSVVLVARSGTQAYGYQPSNINISGLEIRDAYQAYNSTDASGNVTAYPTFAASLYLIGCNNITIQNCTLDNSGLGLFILSDNGSAYQSTNIMVEGNHIYGNGVPGSYGEHDVYAEADGITYQYNDFGSLRPGSGGSELKDRSAGTVIRYNYFTPAANMLDLVDPEDASYFAALPSFANTYVYGNILNDTGPMATSSIVEFGGDSGDSSIYRPNLYFYDNTVVSELDQSTAWRTDMFNLDTSGQSVYAANNIFYSASATVGAPASTFEFAGTVGNITFSGTNWVSPGWLASESAEQGSSYTGTITGTNTFFVDPNNNPGFVDPSAGDYHLSGTSNAIGIAGTLGSSWPAVTQEYAPFASYTSRPSGADDGGFQAAPLIPTVIAETPVPGGTNLSVGTSLTVNFNEPVQASTIGFTLKSSSGTSVPVTLSYDDSLDTATWTLTAPLAASTTYTATVSGAENLSGGSMSSPFSWSFTTSSDAVIPTLVSKTPAASATGVGVSPTVSATFNESVQAGTISMAVTTSAGTSVPGTAAYNSTTNTITWTPFSNLLAASVYTVTVSGAADALGSTMIPATWSFTTSSSVGSGPFSIWNPVAAPDNLNQGTSGQPVDVGVDFYSDVSGFITGIRFYKGTSDTGTHTGDLWTIGGTLLASATFTNETASGWQQVNFATPVAITAGTTYVASYNAPTGLHAQDDYYFGSTYSSGPLHVPANGGVYTYGGPGTFPGAVSKRVTSGSMSCFQRAQALVRVPR